MPPKAWLFCINKNIKSSLEKSLSQKNIQSEAEGELTKFSEANPKQANDSCGRAGAIAIGRSVMGLAVPAIAQLILQTLVFMVDRAMLGHYSTEALASMRISGPLNWCIYGTLSAFSVGAMAIAGRAVGGGNRSLAAATARGCVMLAISLGTAIALLSWIALDSLLALLPFGSATVQADANGYLSIVLSAMPLQLLAIVAAAILQASGNTKIPFVVAAIANSVNVLINYCLIFGYFGAPALGVRGAAIGSVAAIAINAFVLSLILYRGTRVLTLRGRGGELTALKRVLHVSAPVFSERLFRSLGYLGFSAMIGMLGSVAMASYEITLGIEEVCYHIAEGFGIATAAIVSQSLGARCPQVATIGTAIAAGLSVAVLAIGSLMFLVIPQPLLSLFSEDPQIIAAGVPCLYVAAVAQPFMATSIAIEQALRSAGDTQTAFYVSLVGWFVVRLIATYLFAFVFHWGLIGVWLGSTCDWIVRAAVLVVVFWRGQWRQVSV